MNRGSVCRDPTHCPSSAHYHARKTKHHPPATIHRRMQMCRPCSSLCLPAPFLEPVTVRRARVARSRQPRTLPTERTLLRVQCQAPLHQPLTLATSNLSLAASGTDIDVVEDDEETETLATASLVGVPRDPCGHAEGTVRAYESAAKWIDADNRRFGPKTMDQFVPHDAS